MARKCRICKEDLREEKDNRGIETMSCDERSCEAHGVQFRKKFGKWKKVLLKQEKKK